ncbi:MAG: hypothetical protein Q7R85_04505 [bacterium]|nr:hypothetical protein [bacterium]
MDKLMDICGKFEDWAKDMLRKGLSLSFILAWACSLVVTGFIEMPFWLSIIIVMIGILVFELGLFLWGLNEEI